MSELTDFADLVLKENPTEEELREIKRLSPKYQESELGRTPTPHRVIYPDGRTEVYPSRNDMLREVGIGTRTVYRYLNTDVPIPNGRNKGLLIYTEGEI